MFAARDEAARRVLSLARVIRGSHRQWNPEVAMRYMPVVRLLRRRGLGSNVVEVGSGSHGLAPYLRRRILAIDMCFPGTRNARLVAVRGSALALPVRNRACRTVVSLDMLEHMSADGRPQALDELVRIAGGLLILGCPCGRDAMQQDRHLHRTYWRRHGADYPYLWDHVEYGLPTEEELSRWIEQALEHHRRVATITYQWNSNLAVRKALMVLWIWGSRWSTAAWLALVYFHPILTRLNFAKCYRLFAVVEFFNGHLTSLPENL